MIIVWFILSSEGLDKSALNAQRDILNVFRIDMVGYGTLYLKTAHIDRNAPLAWKRQVSHNPQKFPQIVCFWSFRPYEKEC
jgi:hypothetical protein